MFRKGLVASLGVAMAMLSLTPVHAAPLEPKQYGDFDRYVLALSWQTGFCQSQHDRGGREPEDAIWLRHATCSQYAGGENQPEMFCCRNRDVTGGGE